MNRKVLVVAAAVVVAGGAAGYFFVARRTPAHARPASSTPSEHAAEMDHAMGAVLAEYDASPGSTPCESAYNAFKASQDYSTQQHVTPVVLRLAPRDEFLQRCAALPSDTQQCLVPVYLAKHRADCAKARPSADALAPMIELKTVREPRASDPNDDVGPPGTAR